jgi:hypothetical protein
MHHVHEWRFREQCDDSGLLRLYVRHDESRLHLLRSHEQHAGLLRLLNRIMVTPHETPSRVIASRVGPASASLRRASDGTPMVQGWARREKLHQQSDRQMSNRSYSHGAHRDHCNLH